MLKRKEKVYQVGQNPEYSRKKLKEIISKSHFWKTSQDIHARRCDADLMYAIFFAPKRMLNVKHEDEHEEQIQLVDRIMNAFFTIISKKNHPSFEQSRRIEDTRTFLNSDMADINVKVFNILMMLNRETELQQIIRTGFDEKSPYNMWGEECNYHFSAFLSHLNFMVEATLNWNYNELNIVNVVRNFVRAARTHYVMT